LGKFPQSKAVFEIHNHLAVVLDWYNFCQEVFTEILGTSESDR